LASFRVKQDEPASGGATPLACDTQIVAIEGLLLDIDGVLAVSWEALPGAVGAMKRLREDAVPFRLITNTTTKTRADLAGTLRGAGFDVAEEEVVTAVVATTANLRAAHPGSKVFVLSDGDATEDLAGIDLVPVEDADVIVIGGACDDFTYATLNAIFRRLMDGASLVGMHRNLFWKTIEG
jgi:HAD superfamily hydrolase (TIGR01450 family)